MKPHEIRTRTFEEKLIWFRNQLENRRISWKLGADFLKVRRDHVLEDSVRNFGGVNWRREVKIEFEGEQVQDVGGLFREWASLVSKEMFSKDSGSLSCL